MTHRDAKSHLLDLQDSINRIKEDSRLIKLASKEDGCTPDNFANIHLLLEIYQSHLECEIENLDYGLSVVTRYVHSEKVDVDVVE
ncbi:hypothetical protein [[Scytonema hofmanni] UTEX B 1581]|uniref:hypothetical protein n=1 Tax=[Scytonema hofmanni] UTEX B 1581 TaxID=379535 RepID=UPI000496A9D0|nr:hypothetical protein [[Scytonema hofmanni] UTEX B 1581]